MKSACPTTSKSSRDRRETTTQSDRRRSADLSGARHAALDKCRDPDARHQERDRRPKPPIARPQIRQTVSRNLLQVGDHSHEGAAVRKENCAPSAIVTKDSGR